MRKLVVVGFIVAGSAIGLLSALGESWALKGFMMGLGALVGATAGGGGGHQIGRADRARGAYAGSQDLAAGKPGGQGAGLGAGDRGARRSVARMP